MNHQTWKNTGLVATVVIVLSLPLSLLLNRTNGPVPRSVATFAGGTTCIECHQKEYRLWKGSDHDRAMAIASDSSVVGNFNNATFTVNGKTSKFYKRDGKFFVFTEGVGGVQQELQVTHTFGIRPLQQYLIPFENGKYQCLPIAWNTVEKKWFHMAGMVYKPEDLQPDNWLYWTNQAQNWNSMCAECHSTNLQKNYDLEKKTYNTTWSDINVNCEACHGPGSLHNDWAKLPEMGRPQDVNAGLTIQTSKITSRKYVEDCARCHARRGSLGDFDYHNSGFLDNSNPQLPTTPIYHVDGQFLDEDYEYGSFTQSKMYMKEVRCGDCHDPHSLKRKFEGNALCNQCHRDTEYDTPIHHMHKLKGESGTSFVNKRGERLGPGDGALCRDCHMPHKYYMGVDKRYDHSMRIPRPDLSVKLGTPNACTNCHDDKTDEWALQWVNKWYGERRKPHYGTVLYDALNGKAGADLGLLKMINSNLYPEIIRATAIGYLSAYRSPKATEAVKRALNDPDPLLRYAAVQNYMASDSAGLFNTLVPLVNDPVKLVRMEAGNRLSTYRKSAFNPIQYEAFVKALDESKKAQENMADFPSGSYNLGNYYAKLNNLPKAEAFYKSALEIDNLFYPAKTNLAMIYYQQGKTDLAAAIYKDIVAKHPETTDGYYYLALLYSEQKKYPEAIGLLEKAVTLPGNNPRLFYNLGLLYQMVGSNEKASTTFVRGLQLDAGNFDLLYALFVFHINQKNMDKARLYIEQLVKWYPNEPQVQEMYRNFSNQR